MAYNWVQKLAPASLTATSDPRVHAVADTANSREWFMFRQYNISAGTGKLWRNLNGTIAQISAGPNTWTYYYAINYNSSMGTICVTSERKFATSSPTGTPSWTEFDVAGSNAKHFTDKPFKKFSTALWMGAIAPHQVSSTSISFMDTSANGYSSYGPSSQSFLTQQVAAALTTSSVAAELAVFSDNSIILGSVDSGLARPFATQSNTLSSATSATQILPGFNFSGASKAVFTVTNGTSTDIVTVNSTGTATIIGFSSLLIRPGIEANLTGAGNRAYLIRSDGRMYESNSTATSFSLLATSSVPQLSVGGNTALHMYLDYENKPSVILSDGSVYQLKTVAGGIGGIKRGVGF